MIEKDEDIIYSWRLSLQRGIMKIRKYVYVCVALSSHSVLNEGKKVVRLKVER